MRHRLSREHLRCALATFLNLAPVHVWCQSPTPASSLCFRYDLVEPSSLFEVTSCSGEIRVRLSDDGVDRAALLDFEAAHWPFTITLRVSDEGIPPKTAIATVTISLRDVVEAPSLSYTPLAASVKENVPEGHRVAEARDTMEIGTRYAILSVSGSSAFSVDVYDGMLATKLAASGANILDFETQPTTVVTIEVSITTSLCVCAPSPSPLPLRARSCP